MSDEPYNDTGKAELRDRIAMKAMHAVAAGSDHRRTKEIAEWCYELADAMLKARENSKQALP